MYSNCSGTAIQTGEPEARHIFGSFAPAECFKYKPTEILAFMRSTLSTKLPFEDGR